MNTLTITDSGREASRQRTFTRREFMDYEAAMRGESPAATSGTRSRGDSSLEERLTFEQWSHQNPTL